MTIRFIGLAIGLIAIASTAQANEDFTVSDQGYWVIVGSVRPWHPDAAKAHSSITAAMQPCGLTPFNDQSGKFDGFRPGLEVYAVGAFRTRTSAEVILDEARDCIPDAYIKWGSYSGE